MDTPGSCIENYDYTRFIRGKIFAFLVFDVSDRNSFAILEDFIENFNYNSKNNDNRILYIIGNKTDKANRVVKEDEARSFADSYNLKYFEISAKDGNKIETVFQNACE